LADEELDPLFLSGLNKMTDISMELAETNISP
jgi:hypothetical protein